MNIASDNIFAAEVINGTNLNTITGHFNVSPEGCPTRCEYKADNWPSAKVVVSYDYAGFTPSTCMPMAFTVDAYNLLTRVHSVGYKIVACDFGELPLPSVGYTIDLLTNLGGINLRIRDIMGTVVFHDGAIYDMDKTGGLRVVTRDWTVQPTSAQSRRRYAIWGLLLTTALPGLWFIARAIEAVRKGRNNKRNV
jgi:hypothetical protein